jgi:inositol-1,4,5-trisphosphate 5-phosphatase
MGDLNFRTRYQGSIGVDEQGEEVNRLVSERRWKELNAADELRMALDNQRCLFGFKTPQCNFPPTFKLERQGGYTYQEKRTPSYTDRILWKTGNSLEHNIKPLLYEPIDDFESSDHKPIRGAFEIQLNKPLTFRKKEMM